MSKLRLAVFISGSGRTLQNLIRCSQTSHSEMFEVVLVGADRPCSGMKFAQNMHVPRLTATKRQDFYEHPDIPKSMFDFYRVDVVCLAGYLSKFRITEELENRVINIHPSLIPKYCGQGWYGMKVHEAVIAAGEKESGCTVHFCDNEFDHGPILLQNRLAVDPSWDAETLAHEVFELEKETYPAALALLYNRQKELQNGQGRQA